MTAKKKRTDFSRLDWQRQVIGRITIASGATSAKELRACHAILAKLYDAGQWDTLRAAKAGDISMRELKAADRAGRLLRADLLGDIHLRKPLWKTLERVVGTLGKKASTRHEYRSVLAGFAKRRILPADATLADLLTVKWANHRDKYGTPANWNHLGRMLSAALSRVLGDRHHSARREFVKAFGGYEKEPKGREVVLSGGQLRRLLEALPEVVRPGAVLMASTGVRIGEYLHAAPKDYDAETGQLVVTGKTGRRTVIVPEIARPWARVALPYPWSYRSLYNHIKRAAADIGRPDLRPHDLRHAAALFSLDAGAALIDVQEMLGHDDIDTTMRYTRTQARTKASEALGRMLADVLPTVPAHIGPGGVVTGRRSDGSAMPGHGVPRPTSTESSTRRGRKGA